MQEQPTTIRLLAAKAIEQDLLGPEVVLEPDQPTAPPGYELRRHLGEGGCGVVWLAHDTRLDRSVAIKFLTDARPADLERFRREARFTARLNSPAIVQVYELGEADEGPYIAMQYIDGGNLADASLDPAGVVRVLREVAVAMKHAHAEGIVHRDIKPQNILLDHDGRAYLTDFGIARNLAGELGETISTEGQVMGTPGLMPPEQARGEIQAVDARSDVYALGATLYLKLTGSYPFEGTNIIDVLHAVIHEPAPLMRSRRASIPRGLESIAVKCMQKAREDRYQRMDEVIDDFDRFTAGAKTGGESSAWFRRLVAASEGETVENLQSDTDWTMGMEIVRELASWDTELYRVTGSLTRSFRRLDSIRERLEDILQRRPETAWARFYRGVALLRRGRLQEARDEMERTIDRVKNLAGAYFELGRLYIALHLRGQHDARKHITQIGISENLVSARGLLEQALVAFREAQRLGGELPGWLEDCTGAVARLSESDYAGCIKICDEILVEEPDIESVWKLRGDAQHLAGEDPFESYDRALQVRRTYFEALYAKADAHLSRNQITEARQALERAREIHPEYVDAVALLARTYLVETRQGAQGETIDTGLRLAEEALDLDRTSYDAAVILAELKIEMGRSTRQDKWLVSAIETLREAARLQGCQNHVNILTASASLERARQDRLAGRNPRPHLEFVMDLCRSEAAQNADNQPWVELREQAAAILSAP